MLYILLIGSLTIFLIYRNSINRNFTSFSSFVKANKVLVYLFCIFVIPVSIVSIFYNTKIYDSPEEKIYIGEKYDYYTLQVNGLNEQIALQDSSAAAHINYVNNIFQVRDEDLFKCQNLRNKYKKSEQKSHRLTLEYLNYYCDQDYINIAYLNVLDTSEQTVNFLKGLYFIQRKQPEKSEQYFLNEVKLNSEFKPSYYFLFQFYKEHDPDRLKELMNNSAFTDYIEYYLKNDYYYEEGMWFNYFLVQFEERVLKSPWVVIFAAFLISFSWMFFLRALDIYNRERWQDIVLVFSIGAIGTLFCLPMYEFADRTLGLEINGEALNDFLYCTFVIGGSEEIVKLAPWLLFGIFTKRLKEPFDYILYACVSALGFAFLENLMYLERYNNVTGRAIMAGVGHMFDASIVAYFIVLAKYRFKKLSSKTLAVFAGFVLAMLAHGFYDFWLISPSVSHLKIITPIFFLISLQIWFYFINNTMNISPYFNGGLQFNTNYKQDILSVSIFTLLIVEYVIVSVEIGTQGTNYTFTSGAILSTLFILFMHFRLQQINLLQGKWFHYTFGRIIPRMKLSLFSLPNNQDWVAEKEINSKESHVDYSGMKLRLFAPKSNLYVGDKLPVTGRCIRKVSVAGNPNWYIFQLETAIDYPNMVKDYIILKNKNDNELLAMDKIEIYLMLIPDKNLLQQQNIEINSLRYVGRTYSRPV